MLGAHREDGEQDVSSREMEKAPRGLLGLMEGEGAHGEKLALRPLSGWSHHSSQEEARAQIRSFGLKLAHC